MGSGGQRPSQLASPTNSPRPLGRLFRWTTKPKPQPGEQPSRGFGASHEGRSLQKGPSTNTNIHFWRSQVRPVVSPWLTSLSGSARGLHDLGTSLDEGNAATSQPPSWTPVGLTAGGHHRLGRDARFRRKLPSSTGSPNWRWIVGAIRMILPPWALRTGDLDSLAEDEDAPLPQTLPDALRDLSPLPPGVAARLAQCMAHRPRLTRTKARTIDPAHRRGRR